MYCARIELSNFLLDLMDNTFFACVKLIFLLSTGKQNNVGSTEPFRNNI